MRGTKGVRGCYLGGVLIFEGVWGLLHGFTVVITCVVVVCASALSTCTCFHSSGIAGH